MQCSQCGTQVPDCARFCPFCGCDQTVSAPQNPVQQPMPPQGNMTYPQNGAQQQGNAIHPQPQPNYVPQQSSQPQGYSVPQQPQQAQGYSVPPQPSQPQPYYAPQQGIVPPQPAAAKKKKNPLPIILAAFAVVLVAAVLAVVLPKIIHPDAGEATTAEELTGRNDPTMPTEAPEPVPAGYQSLDVGEVNEDVALYTYFDVRQGINEPSVDKVFPAPNRDGWGDPFYLQTDELTLHTSNGETPFTIAMESACSPAYAYLTGNRYYGDGIDVEAHMEAKAGDKYLFRMENTDGDDWSYYIYDKKEDTLVFLGYYSWEDAYGNYLLLSPYNSVGYEAPVFVYDWSGKQIHIYESVYDCEEYDGALYLLYGYESLKLDRIPLDRFSTTQFDPETEHLADYPDYTGLFARTQGGDLQVSLVRRDKADIRIFGIDNAKSVADAIQKNPAPAAEPVKVSCSRFTAELPAFFEGRVDIVEEEDGVFLYVPDGEYPVLLYGLKLIPEEEYGTLAYNSRVAKVLKNNGRTYCLVELNPLDVGAFPFESGALWDALRANVGDIPYTTEFTGDFVAEYPPYHELPERYESASGDYRFRILNVDFADLRCSFCKLEGYGDVADKLVLDVKMVGDRGLLLDGSYQVGELRLEEGRMVIDTAGYPDPAFEVSDLVLFPVESSQ